VTATLVLDDASGAIQYLRPEVFSRPGIYSPASPPLPAWVSRGTEANVVFLPVYTLSLIQHKRYLTPQEQQVFSVALRKSVNVVHRGAARK
jgi:hypothetical protein